MLKRRLWRGLNGGVVLRIPAEVLSEMGWKVGDTLKFDIPTHFNGIVTLEKAKEDKT